MEKNSQPLATESFSYSWLIHKPPPSSDDNLRRIEHSSVEDEENFHFDVTTSPTDLVNADEIFSHGQIMPVYADRSSTSVKPSTSVAASPVSVYPSRITTPFPDRKRYYIIGKWRRSSKKIMQKWLGFVKTVGCSRKSSRVDDLDRKVFEVRSFSNSLEASPRQSSAYSVVEWGDLEINSASGFDIRRDHCLKIDKNWRSSCSSPDVTTPFRSSNYSCCDADENSIREAILYCKRSIEK